MVKGLVVLLSFSFVLEVEQALFNEGHCRLRDVLPNLIIEIVSPVSLDLDDAMALGAETIPVQLVE